MSVRRSTEPCLMLADADKCLNPCSHRPETVLASCCRGILESSSDWSRHRPIVLACHGRPRIVLESSWNRPQIVLEIVLESSSSFSNRPRIVLNVLESSSNRPNRPRIVLNRPRIVLNRPRIVLNRPRIVPRIVPRIALGLFKCPRIVCMMFSNHPHNPPHMCGSANQRDLPSDASVHNLCGIDS